MKILALIPGCPRSGSDFLQSLFDSHPEVSQFPGDFYFDKFWSKITKQNLPENIANIFISDNERFFDSKLNLIERHHMLGENKNDFYLIDRNLFKEKFINLMQNKEINKKNVFHNLHFAYSLASGEDLKKKKVIILNIHHIFRLKILKEFDYEILFTIRDPLASLSSSAKHWLKYDKGKHVSPWMLYFHIDRLLNGLKILTKSKIKTHVIKLELLHRQNSTIMKELANKFNINYDQVLTKSTYHNKIWWGDIVSGRDLNGVNPNFKNSIDYNFFYKKDIQCFERCLRGFLIKYNYQILEKNLKFPPIKILPLKVEIQFWKKSILSMKIIEILSIFYYWVKRIHIMKRNIYDNIDFPDQIGK